MENNQEPEFWTVLKTPPKTEEDKYIEIWTEAIAAVRAAMYSQEDLLTHFEIEPYNEN